MLSQVIGPLPNVEAKPLFTATFTCTALAAIVAGPIKARIVRTPGSRQSKSNRKRKPRARGGGNLDKQLQETAKQRPEREPDQSAFPEMRMPPVRLRIKPVAQRHAADDRADIEEARSHRRNTKDVFRVQHSHDERGERNEEDERKHDPREQDR